MIKVYKITSRLNGKVYVGQTRLLIEKRFLQHAKSDTPLGKAMRDCGLENFAIEIIEECETLEQAQRQEKFWIKALDCKMPNGYNRSNGGEHGRIKNERLHLILRQKIQEKFATMLYMSPIPGERDLCKEYNVSRPTIRKALKEMEQGGLLSRIQGRGTFYIGNKVAINYTDDLTNEPVLTQILKSHGKITRSHVLKQTIELPETKIAANLHIPEDDFVFHLQRLRYIDDELYSLANDYIPLNLCPILPEIDFSDNTSLLKTLEENGVVPYREDKIIDVISSDALTAIYLQVKKDEPLVVERTITFDKNENIISYTTTIIDAYKSRFFVSSSVEK